jgi:hypothetical protein
MDVMDFEVLPGPSRAELARTAPASAAAAEIEDARSPDDPVYPGRVPAQVPVRDGRDGSPLLLPVTGSVLEHQLAAQRDAVTVTVPAAGPYAALRLTGTVRLTARNRRAGIAACMVDLRSVELISHAGARVRVPLPQYRAAVPDPLWREAPGVLQHLEHGHMTDLIACVRMHGLPQADWVIARGLDRYGLELLVLTTDGVAAVRLGFPDGPVTSLRDVPASIRTALTCRCESARHPRLPGRETWGFCPPRRGPHWRCHDLALR